MYVAQVGQGTVILSKKFQHIEQLVALILIQPKFDIMFIPQL